MRRPAASQARVADRKARSKQGPLVTSSSISRAGPAAPLLLLVGSGDRRYREYIVATLAERYRLWLLDSIAPTWQVPYIEGVTATDTKDPAALIAAATALGTSQSVSGVFCYDEATVHATSLLAKALALPGTPPESVLACRDKARTRSLLRDAAIPQPASILVASAGQAQAAANSIGYPVVVKARGLAGSLGVVRADRPADVPAAFTSASSASYPGVPRYPEDVLVEEFLTGPEISFDTVIDAGTCTPMVLARKRVGLEPFFEEFGHTVDAADPLLEDPELLDQLARIHKALGFTSGATHAEFKLTAAGPRLVEINARLGGDFIPYLGMLATGTDPVLAAADVATGRTPSTAPLRQRVAGIRFLYPPSDCQVVDIVVHLDRAGPSVHRAVATGSPGTQLLLPPRGYLSRYGYVMAAGDHAQVANDLRRPEQLIELRSCPLPDGSPDALREART
jgi:ATP-grasp domain